jgi:hypothetical protein
MSASGEYSSKSAYRSLFEGTVISPHHNAIWDWWAPLKCKVFAWLTSLDQCWTNQRRLRHGLSDNDTCALRDQDSDHYASHDTMLLLATNLVRRLQQAQPSILHARSQWWVQQLVCYNYCECTICCPEGCQIYHHPYPVEALEGQKWCSLQEHNSQQTYVGSVDPGWGQPVVVGWRQGAPSATFTC